MPFDCFYAAYIVHNRINIYPLPYYGMECCSMPRASGGQDGSVVVFFLFFRPCPDVPSKSSPRPQRHIFLCVRLTVVHWLYFLSFCALIVRINTG